MELTVEQFLKRADRNYKAPQYKNLDSFEYEKKEHKVFESPVCNETIRWILSRQGTFTINDICDQYDIHRKVALGRFKDARVKLERLGYVISVKKYHKQPSLIWISKRPDNYQD
jgi:hypothetical protein